MGRISGSVPREGRLRSEDRPDYPQAVMRLGRCSRTYALATNPPRRGLDEVLER